MAVHSKVYVAASADGASPVGRMHALGSAASAWYIDGDDPSLAASAPSSPSSRRYQSALKSGASSSHFDRPLTQRSNPPSRSWTGNLRRPWWLFRRHVVRPVQRKYRKLSWTTRTTVSTAISLFTVLYVLFTVPFRVGFLYNPFGSFDTNTAWTPELKTFLPIDLVADAVGLVKFTEFYHVWRDAFSQLSQSVAFEVGKKMARDARTKSPKQPRARKTSSIMRSSQSNWTLNTITPSASSAAAANKHYREKRLQFALEIVAVLPLEVFALATGQLNALHAVRITKLCRVYRLPQCLGRLAKIYSESTWVQQLSYTGISGLIKRVGLGIVLAHWFACGYMLVAHAECGVFFEFCRPDKPTSWVVRDQLLSGTLARKYARSLYWAARTMVLLGYDDVTPVSDTETVYAIVVQVIGALVSTSILAMFQFIFRYRNSRRAAFAAHVDNARAYMKAQNIPRAVRRQVMDYFSYTWATHHGLDSEAALRLMPRHLQAKVEYTLKASRVKQVCFLMKQSVEFVNHLALTLQHRVYSPGDTVIEPKVNAKMFFVIRGTVTLTAADGSESGTKKQCGTGDFFADSCLLSPATYDETAVAKTFCELYVLEKTSLDAAIAHFYRGHEQEARDRMANVLDKYSTQLRKTKRLLGLRGSGGDTDNTNVVTGVSGSSGLLFARLGTAWRLPGSAFRLRWDMLRFSGIIFVAFEVPYYLVFIANDDAQRNLLVEQEHGVRYATTWATELFFAADIVLRASVFAFLDPTVMLHAVDADLIFAAYKANGLLLDVAAVVPVSLIVETMRGKIEGYLWMFRLVRLLRLRHALELLQDLGDYYGTSSKTQFIATLFLGVVYTLHLTGCLWFVMAWIPLLSNENVGRDVTGVTGLTRQSCLYMATQFQNCSWIAYDCYGHIGWAFPIEDAHSYYTTPFAYLRSVYWAVVALTAVGYGDIVAFSTAESFFAAVWIFVGGILNFGVVGAMSSTLSTLLASQHERVEKINALNSLMAHLRISPALRDEIRHFYHKQFASRQRAYESELLLHLPEQLCYQISSLLHAESTRRIALFRSASPAFRDEVTGKFRHRSFQSGETIVFEGETSKECFVFLHGKVNVFFQSKRVPVGAYHDGDCYGVSELVLRRPHTTTLTAASQVHASVLTRDHLDAVLLKFANDVGLVKDEAHRVYRDDVARLQRIAQNLENAKLQPHVMTTTSLFYQKDSGHPSSSPSSYTAASDLDALRLRLQNTSNAVLTLCNVYNAFVVIFRVAFHAHLHVSDRVFTAMVAADIGCDLVFVADMYLKTYYFGCDEVGLENLRHRTVADSRYRKSAGFKLDLLASLPLYVVDRHRPFASAMCRLPRLVRCYSLWTCIDDMIIQTQQRFASQNVSSYLSPLKLLFFLLLIAHYAASVFFLISDYECRYSTACWLETDHMLHTYHHAIGALYIRSFYWALTTLTLVGSREIVPRGYLGTLWATLTCFSCTFVMGHILGELSDLIIDMNKDEKEHKRRLESFESFAKAHALPERLRERVALFFTTQREQTQGTDLHETLKDLSANLRLKLMHEMYGAAIGQLPISRFLARAQVNNLALRLSTELFIPGDDIVAEGTLGTRLCILRKGLAGVFWTDSITNVAVLLEGCLFGELAFFVPHQRRLATVKAATSCEVLHISKHRWHELWAVDSGDVSEHQVEKHALNAILDWVKDRAQRYQASCLQVAAKAKRHLLHRRVAANLKGVLAVPTAGPGRKHPLPRLQRGLSLATPELLLLEKKAKYLLAKAEVFAAKRRQFLANARSSAHSSARSSRMSVRVVPALLGSQADAVSRRHLPSLATSGFLLNKKKTTPTKAVDAAMQQFFVQVNPVNKHVRDQLNDGHLAQLETECWRRSQSLASVASIVNELMNATLSPHVVRTPLEASNSAAQRQAVSGLESSLHKPAGIDFELLQRCKRPKFSALYRLYRAYRRWKTGESRQLVPSESSSSSATSDPTQGKAPSVPSNLKVRTRASLSSRTSRRASVPWEKAMKAAAHGSHSAVLADLDEFLAVVKRVGRLWELVMLLIAVYFSFSVLFKVCFVNDLARLSPGALRAWSALEYLLDTLCLFNVVRKVLQSSYFARIVLLREKKELRLSTVLAFVGAVAMDAGFRYDIVAVLPLDLLVFALDTPSASGGASYPATWKRLCFLRLNKLFHATQIGRLSESVIQYVVYEAKAPVSEVQLCFVRSLASYVTMGHYIACIWYAASERAYRDYGYSWLSTPGMLVSTTTTTDADADTLDLSHVSLGRKYFRALHFAVGSVTTLFYGDIVSMNLVELVTELAVILWSIYIYGTLVGAHAEVQQAHSKQKAIVEQNLSELQHYVMLNDVPKALKRQVKQFYASTWRRQRGDDEFGAIAGLSRTLQEDVVYATLYRFAWNVSLFHALDLHFLRALLVRLTFVVCTESEEVVIKGDVDRSMYFIATGRILVKQPRYEVTKAAGEFFGELALLYGVPRHETCVSLATTELYRLDHAPYEELLLEFPDYRVRNKLAWTTADASSASAPHTMLHTTSLRAVAVGPGSHGSLFHTVGDDIVDDNGNQLVRSDNSGGIAEEAVPACFVYRATMELLAHLDKIDVVEAKRIVSKGTHGAREYMKRAAAVVTARHLGSEDVRGFRDSVRNFDSTNHLLSSGVASTDDDGAVGVGSNATMERWSGGGSSHHLLFQKAPSVAK